MLADSQLPGQALVAVNKLEQLSLTLSKAVNSVNKAIHMLKSKTAAAVLNELSKWQQDKDGMTRKSTVIWQF